MAKETTMNLMIKVPIQVTVKDGKMTYKLEENDVFSSIKTEIERRMNVIKDLDRLVNESDEG